MKIAIPSSKTENDSTSRKYTLPVFRKRGIIFIKQKPRFEMSRSFSLGASKYAYAHKYHRATAFTFSLSDDGAVYKFYPLFKGNGQTFLFVDGAFAKVLL